MMDNCMLMRITNFYFMLQNIFIYLTKTIAKVANKIVGRGYQFFYNITPVLFALITKRHKP
jgi:hypothetical protein